MKKIAVHLANGFEEVEALAPVDIWRRAGYEVTTVSITGSKKVSGSHAIVVEADQLFETTHYNEFDLLFLPGGMPGASNLDAHSGLANELVKFNKAGKILAAICAAPLVLGHKKLLEGKKACCFPGFEKELHGANIVDDYLVSDGNIITGKGMGVAIPFALQIVARFDGFEKARILAQKMQLPLSTLDLVKA